MTPLHYDYPPQSAEWHKKQARWRHNSFIGSARMTQVQMQAIIGSGTAKRQAKCAAARILRDARKLEAYLRAGRKKGT